MLTAMGTKLIVSCAPTQAVLDERLLLVVGTKLETYYREQLLPPFVTAYGEIAAACVQLSCRVGGHPVCQVMQM